MTTIHPHSLVSPHAIIGRDVSMGAFCVVEDDVVVGDGCQIGNRVTIKSGTRLGALNNLADGVVLGGMPQHANCPESVGRLEIGDSNVFRENVTVHVAMHQDQATRIGDQNLLMVNTHLGHDCVIADNVIIANNVMLAGHVQVEKRAYISGAVGVHQFCRVGMYAMVGGQAHITKDVPPFVTIDGLSSRIVGLNIVGLRRAGFDNETISELKRAYRIAFRSGMLWKDTMARLQNEFSEGVAAEFYRFLSNSKRGCILERSPSRSATLRIFQDDESQSPGSSKAA